MSFVKKHAIRDIKASSIAQDIDDNFDAIWNALRTLRNNFDGQADVVSGVVGSDGAQGPPGDDGAPGDDGVPGPQGIPGTAGSQGPAGPVTLGPMGLDGIDGEDGMPIPGAQGATGPTGATGASGAWTLISTTTAAGAAQYDFTSLSAYTDILVVIKGITRSVSGITSFRVSTDNGSTFLSASGDYLDISAAGVEANATLIPFHTTNATAARTGYIYVHTFNNTGAKPAVSTDVNNYLIPTTTALNALRVYSGAAGGNLNAGTIYVYGR